MTRKERIQKAFAHLIGEGKIKNKQQVADIMEMSRPSVSKAYNGYDSYLTNDFLKKFCLAFPEFNLKWLIDEDGSMLVESVKNKIEKPPSMSLEERFDDLMKQHKQLLSILEADRDSYTRVIEKLANELADIKVTLRQMASGQPVQYYSVADGDVNPVNLNDPLKQIK